MGQDVPRGHSTRARLFTIEISQKDVDWNQLTRCQVEARKGEYAGAFAGYLQYIAPRYASIRAGLRQQMAKWRTLATQSEMHKRTPEIVAELAVGLNRFLHFARSCEALSQDEAKEYWSRFWTALGDAASKQREQHHSEEPTTRFLSLINGVLSSGSAHLADAHDGFSPAGAKGRCIGWFDCDHVFLDPDTAFAEVQRLAREQGDALPISQKTLWKRMKDGGLLALHDDDRNLSSQIINGHKRHLLALDAHRLPISADIKSHRNRTDFPEK